MPDKMAKGQGICWQSTDEGLTGTYCAVGDAKISVWDAGFYRGVALYDYASLWQGWIRKLDSHINRFYKNMHACGMDSQISKEQFTEQVIETVRQSRLQDAAVWEVATWGPYKFRRGDKKLGGTDHKIGLQVWVEPYRWAFPPEFREEGIRLIIPSTRAYPPQCINPRIKHFDRLNFHLAQLEVVNAGVDGFISLTIDGHLSESSGSNLWLVNKGRLFTPSENTLEGVTSECVYDLASEMNIEAKAAFLTAWDLYTADEAFLCTSAGGIFPISEVDSRTIGNGKPGSTSRRLIDAYWKMHVNPKYAVKVY